VRQARLVEFSFVKLRWGASRQARYYLVRSGLLGRVWLGQVSVGYGTFRQVRWVTVR